MGATERAAERAVALLKRAIDAAENSNQAGEDFVVAAAAGPALLGALREYMTCVSLVTSPATQGADVLTLLEVTSRLEAARLGAESAIARATGAASDNREMGRGL